MRSFAQGPFPEEHLSEELLRNAEALTEAEDSRVKLDAALPPTADSQRQIVSFLSAVTAALGGWKQAFNARKEKAELEFEQAADSLRSTVNATFEAMAFKGHPRERSEDGIEKACQG